MRDIRNQSSVKSVQRLTISTVVGTTISAVNPDKTIIYAHHRNGANVYGPWDIGQGSLAAHLTDSTTVNTYSNGSMSNAHYGTVYINVVEYT